MKIAIIGAGSPYTPELVLKLSGVQERLPVSEISLMDIDENRLGIMHGFCERYAAGLGYEVDFTYTRDLQRAVEQADFVVTQLRVGGNKARANDEKIPLSRGYIGQETTGPCGLMKALRTVPVVCGIAEVMEEASPHAWLINYTNPTGIVAEGLYKTSKIKHACLCSGGLFPAWNTSNALNVPPESVRFDYAGLNHLNFAYNISVNGRRITKEELAKVLALSGSVDTVLLSSIGAFASPYLQYYFRRAEMLKKQLDAPRTRAEDVMALEAEIYDAYGDPGNNKIPEALHKRGGGGYSEVAIGVMDAAYNNIDKLMVVNVENMGTLPFLPDDAVIETNCVVNASGVKPIATPPPPKSVWGLISAVKNYEQLTAEAALTGSKELALQALVAHPLVGDYDGAKGLLDEMLEANSAYLSGFGL